MMSKSIDEIKENLEFAAEIMRRLPPVKVRGYFCAWPKFCSDEDFFNTTDTWLPPLPDEIKAMEDILEWLKFTSLENRRIVWLRSCGMGWKRLSDLYHKSRSTLTRQYRNALLDIKNAQDEQKK